MILSNRKIFEALDNGWLKITPQPAPRLPDEGDCPYNTTAIDLRLGPEIVITKRIAAAIDLTQGKYGEIASAITEDDRHNFSHGQPYTLPAHQFVLGTTLETIELPIPPEGSDAPCLAARVEGRSSFARLGLLVHFTAPTIHAGFRGQIILEICNFGPNQIQLHKEMYVCQLIIEQVDGIPFRNDSQFQDQTGATG